MFNGAQGFSKIDLHDVSGIEHATIAGQTTHAQVTQLGGHFTEERDAYIRTAKKTKNIKTKVKNRQQGYVVCASQNHNLYCDSDISDLKMKSPDVTCGSSSYICNVSHMVPSKD